jgi:hypothetical protein
MTRKSGSDAVQSDAAGFLLLKVWIPLLLTSILYISVEDGQLAQFPARWLVIVPTVAAQVFCVSIAAVRIRNEELQYRRFLTWTTVDRADIVSSGPTWFPSLGFLELRQSIAPLRILYFALDTNRNPNPFGKNESRLLRALEDKQPWRAEDGYPADAGQPSMSRVFLALALAAGTLLPIASYPFASKPSVLAGRPSAHTTPLNAVLHFRVLVNSALRRPDVAVPLAVGLLILSVRSRRGPYVLGYAFLGGALLSNTALDIMLG